MDYITLTGVKALGTHGVLDFEHTQEQPFIVDATMYLDLSDASRSDDLVDTVSYAQISQRIVSVIQGEHCDLIERLAQRIADSILLSWRVKKTIVTVHKPQAPMDEDFVDVSVTIERCQKDFIENPEPTSASLHCAQLSVSSQNSESSTIADVSSHDVGAYAQESVSNVCSENETLSNTTFSRDSYNKDANTARAGENSGEDFSYPEFHRVIIALGGNIGDVAHTFRCAIVDLDAIRGNQITGISALYATKPWGVTDANAPDFKNAVVELSTSLTVDELLQHIHNIEEKYGRKRDNHWDSRTLDLDIIDYDGQEIQTDNIMLPHPRAWQRAFVLRPWLDIDPYATLVGAHHGKVQKLIEQTPDNEAVKLLSTSWILGDVQ